MKENVLKEAFEYLKVGISCVPVEIYSKKPAFREWINLQDKPQSVKQVKELFAGHKGNIALITGTASNNLACLDIEDKDLFTEFAEKFREQYGDTWMVSTRRGGHILFRTERPLRKREYEKDGRKYEVRGQGHYSLAPPSEVVDSEGVIHTYEFLSRPSIIPIVKDETFFKLDFWEDNNKEIYPSVKDGSRNFTIGDCFIVFNEINNNGRLYKTRSDYDYAVILKLTKKGVPQETIREAFKQVGWISTHYRRLREKDLYEADKNFDFSYRKALREEDKPEYIELCKKITEQSDLLKSAIINHPDWWKGVRKRTDRDVLLAHIKQFEKSKKDIWNLSARDGSELAETTYKTFNNSTHRLIKDGYIELVTKGRMGNGKSSSYRFGWKLKSILNGTYIHTSPVYICENSGEFNIDTYGVFERAFLGKTAKAVYFTLLKGGPLKASEISIQSGASINSVRKSCKILMAYGLITKSKTLYQAVAGFDFESLSDTLGATEYQTARKRKYQEDRIHREKVITHWRKLMSLRRTGLFDKPILMASNSQENSLHIESSIN